MANPPPVTPALPESGLITNLICDDGSLDLSPYQGNQVLIRAKVIAAESTTPARTLGTSYTAGKFLRQVYASFKLTGALVGSSSPTITYHTTTGGIAVSADCAALIGTTAGSSIIESVTFPVDANGTYSVSASLGGGTVVIQSWVEVDVI